MTNELGRDSIQVQIFDADDIEVAHEPQRKLEVKVAPPMGNTIMGSGQLASCFAPVVTTFPFARQAAVKAGNFVQRGLKVFWHAIFLTSVVGEKRLHDPVRS